MKYEKIDLGPYKLHFINTDKFKTTTISVNFREKIIKEDITKINDTLPSYKHIKAITVQTTPMIKTTTAKIKRHEEIKSENDN